MRTTHRYAALGLSSSWLLAIALSATLASAAGCHRHQREGTTVRASRTDAAGRRALEMAAQDLSCRVSVLRVAAEGDHDYRVIGCSQEAFYTCSRFDCVRRTAAIASYGVPRAAAASWSDDAIRQMLHAINEQALGCFEAVHVPATVRIIVSRTGTITQHAVISDSTPAEGHCLDAVMASVDLDEPGEHVPRTVVLSFEPYVQEVGPSGATPAPTADQAWDAEGSVRAAIEAHAETILVCTSGAPVAVAVSWNAAGTATIGLRGRFAGSPEEGCVRQALSDVSIPSGGRAGSILHPIEAQ